MTFDIVHEREQLRFVTVAGGRTGLLRYRPVDDETLDLTSTWVHPSLRGRGVGEALVRAALDHARAEGYSVIPTCWFVRTVVERHPGYEDLLR